jgi:hypothetical protein
MFGALFMMVLRDRAAEPLPGYERPPSGDTAERFADAIPAGSRPTTGQIGVACSGASTSIYAGEADFACHGHRARRARPGVWQQAPGPKVIGLAFAASRRHIRSMPLPDLSEADRAILAKLVRERIAADRFPDI